MIRNLTFAALAAATLATGARAQESASVPIGDEWFAMKAYAAGLGEIAMSQVAVEKSTDSAVKEFAEKMIKDHTECNGKIMALAREKRIPLPTTLDAIQSAALARMGKMPAAEFDKAFKMAQIGAHKDAIHLFGHEANKGEDSDLKALAGKTLPTLWMHTKSAFELAGEKRECEKFQKVMDYAKEVMAEK